MTIIPAGSKMEAQLYVPTQAAGFLAVGQEVRLAIDAFPFATFGTVPATVKSISTAAISRQGNNGRTEFTYIVTATIPDARVFAFNIYRRLQPDMTLSARIVSERRSLAAWLFEPILAVRRR